jgi:hypothetical protein
MSVNFPITTAGVGASTPVTISANYGNISKSATLMVNSASPTLTSITPNSGLVGSIVSVVMSGSNFGSAPVVSVSGTGIGVSNVRVASPTQISATFTVSGSAAPGGRTVSVTTGGKTSNSVSFSVNLPTGPTLGAAPNPQQGNLGQSVNVKLVGTNFVAGATSIQFLSGSGVSVSNVSVISSTALTAVFTIATNATVGWRQLTVSTPSGSSGARWFAVFGTPAIKSITPVSGIRGSAVTVTLTGSNISNDVMVQFSGTGITASKTSSNSDGTSVTVTFTISSSAPLGTQSITLQNSVGKSNAVPFTVQ